MNYEEFEIFLKKSYHLGVIVDTLKSIAKKSIPCEIARDFEMGMPEFAMELRGNAEFIINRWLYMGLNLFYFRIYGTHDSLPRVFFSENEINRETVFEFLQDFESDIEKTLSPKSISHVISLIESLILTSENLFFKIITKWEIPGSLECLERQSGSGDKIFLIKKYLHTSEYFGSSPPINFIAKGYLIGKVEYDLRKKFANK